MRFGALSTRYKDIFDMCYLTDIVDKDRLAEYIKTYIIEDADMKENSIDAILTRAEQTFQNRTYRNRIQKATRANWMEITIDQAYDKLITFLETLICTRK